MFILKAILKKKVQNDIRTADNYNCTLRPRHFDYALFAFHNFFQQTQNPGICSVFGQGVTACNFRNAGSLLLKRRFSFSGQPRLAGTAGNYFNSCPALVAAQNTFINCGGDNCLYAFNSIRVLSFFTRN